MKKKKNKLTKEKIANAIIAAVTIFALTSCNFIIAGKEVVAFASDLKLNSQTEDTLNKYVKFDTFFMQDNEKTHYLIYDVNGQNQDMYMNISVKEGYLKDATIEFEDKNYTIEGIWDEGQILQDTTNEKISLKRLNADENYSVVAKIGTKIEDKIKLNDLKKDSKVIFKAIHVNKKGTEKQVQKEIKVNVGFKQDMDIQISQEVASYFAYQSDGANKVLVKINAKLNTSKPNNATENQIITTDNRRTNTNS